MATDLGGVSRTLNALITQALAADGQAATVTYVAPDVAVTMNNLVSVFLFHVVESPEFKNLPPVSGSGPVPIQQAPMGLILQYMISVLHSSNTENPDGDALTEQKMIGLIARAIHDYPAITTKTTIQTTILDPALALQNNTIEFNLRPATIEEQFAFWSTQRERVVRLSLFVEARVLVMEPQPPVTFPGIVLSVGSFVFPGAGPQLADSRGVTWFQPPVAGMDLQSVAANPARATLLPRIARNNPPTPLEVQAAADLAALQAQDPVPPHDRLLQNAVVTLDGEGLTPGDLSLVLQKDQLEIIIDPTDPGNAAWQVEVTGSSLQFTVHRNVIAQTAPGAAPGDVLLAPGSYVARVLLADPRFDGKPRGSNEIAFTLVPQILAVGPATPAATNTYTLQIAGDYFTDAGADIDLAVNGSALTEITSGTLAAGQFIVAGPGLLTFMLPSTAPTPGASTPLAVRLVVNGANGTPAWLTQGAP
ncbi:MAG TPA: Pvc16 family protein [Polyangia bacterium]|nr:Pvc16 family protein [Polyangia bacterium]